MASPSNFQPGPIQIQQSYAFAASRFFPMLGAFIVSGFACFLMAITIIGIPFAIAFLVYWLFVLQCASLEGLGPLTAMSRSRDLVRGHWWWTLGFLIVSAILLGIVGSALASLMGVIIPLVGSTIGEILIAPVLIIAQTLFFFELRNRQSPATPTTETA